MVQGVVAATMSRVIVSVSLCGALLSQLGGVVANAAESGAHASIASTSRWWKLDCGAGRRNVETGPAACTFNLRLRGLIDGSRVQLVMQAVQRRDAARRALGRDVKLHVDVDSPGGEIFSALEIGRMLRAEGASISVGKGASCISSCVFPLMGAIERSISSDAHLGIHRPSLRGRPQGGPERFSEDEIVDAMTDQLVSYAKQMNVPRTIVDALMAVPPDRVVLLSPAELARYGIHSDGDVATGKPRARSPSPYPRSVIGR